MKSILVFIASCAVAGSVLAKLPAPNDEAKAKAAEAAAKTAYTGKLEAYQLCKSQNKVAAAYRKKAPGKAPVATPPCADPGPFVYTAAAPAGAPATAGAPAPAPEKKKKKRSSS